MPRKTNFQIHVFCGFTPSAALTHIPLATLPSTLLARCENSKTQSCKLFNFDANFVLFVRFDGNMMGNAAMGNALNNKMGNNKKKWYVWHPFIEINTCLRGKKVFERGKSKHILCVHRSNSDQFIFIYGTK